MIEFYASGESASQLLSVAHTVRVDDAVLARVLVLDAIAEAEVSLVAADAWADTTIPIVFVNVGDQVGGRFDLKPRRYWYQYHRIHYL